MDKLIQTFLDLANFNEVHPHENKILSYIKQRLNSSNIAYRQDAFGNIVAAIPSKTDGPPLAFVGHTDIAAPLNDRKIIISGTTVKTDGKGLLGGDDKTAVAAMLELGDYLSVHTPKHSVELIFTRGEECGGLGAAALDMTLVHAHKALVFDWLGRVNRIITKSPAYYKVDVEYTGKDAHPAEWQHGINAGRALMGVSSGLSQGEYSPDVIFNIGIVRIGNARNKVPGSAMLQAEIRSFDMAKIELAAKEIERHFRHAAAEYKLQANIIMDNDMPVYILDQNSSLFTEVSAKLKSMQQTPLLESTYGCFDGNILAARGMEVVILGASYYNPHAVDEYIDIIQFKELYRFMQIMVIS